MGLINDMEITVEEVVGDRTTARKIVAKLLHQFGGDKIYLPGNHYSYRNQQIAELANAGVDVGKIALRYQLHRRTVERIVKNVQM